MISSQDMFDRLLTALQSPIDSERQAADASLATLRENPISLLQVSSTSLTNTALPQAARFMAAVLFSQTLIDKKFGNWNKLTPQMQTQAKASLINIVSTERDGPIRRKMIACTVDLADYLRRECNDEWPELLPTVFRLSKSSDPIQRETALTLFAELALFLGPKVFQPYFGVVGGILESGLQDNDSIDVRLASLTASVAFLQIMERSDEGNINSYRKLLPLMLGCVTAGIQSQKEEKSRNALELLDELAETQIVFFKTCIPQTVAAVMPIITANSLEDSTRRSAMELLLTLCELRAGAVKRIPGFVSTLIQTVLLWMCQVDRFDKWIEFEDFDNDSIAVYGSEVLDRVCLALHGKTIVPELFGRINSMIQNPDWRARYAAMTAITMSTEGCKTALRKHVQEIISIVGRTCRDEDPMVRWAALNCLGQLCSDFRDFIIKDFGDAVCECFVVGMADPIARVAARSAVCITNFCQAPPEHVKKYVQPILGATHKLLQRGDSVKAQETALTCITSLAEVIEDGFRPYYDLFVPVLKTIIKGAKNKQYSLMRGKALEAFTFIGITEDKDKFMPDALEVMKDMATTPVPSDDPQIGYVEAAWARLAECLQQDFVQFLPLVVPISLERAKVKADIHVFSGSEKPDDGWDVQYLSSGVGVGVHTALLEEKASAIHILACYAAHVGAGFMPYVSEVAKIVTQECGFQLNEGVREAAFSVMPFLLSCIKSNVTNGAATAADLQKLWQFLFEPALKAFADEQNGDGTLPQMLTSLAACLDILAGPSLSAEQLDELTEACKCHLNMWVKHQRDFEDARKEADYDEEDEENTEEMEALAESVLQGIITLHGSICKSHGDAYLPAFNSHFVPILKGMMEPPFSSSLTHKALCMWCDAFEFSHAIAVQHVEAIFPRFVEAARNFDSVPLRQAGVYSIGITAVTLGEPFAPQVPACLNVLREVIMHPKSNEEESYPATDNAISAVVKITDKFASHFNVAELMTFIVSVLPLRSDSIEACTCHDIFFSLLERYPSETVGGPSCTNAPQILQFIAKVVGTPFVNATSTPRIRALLQKMIPHIPQPVLASVAPEHLQKLQALANAQ